MIRSNYASNSVAKKSSSNLRGARSTANLAPQPRERSNTAGNNAKPPKEVKNFMSPTISSYKQQVDSIANRKITPVLEDKKNDQTRESTSVYSPRKLRNNYTRGSPNQDSGRRRTNDTVKQQMSVKNETADDAYNDKPDEHAEAI